MKLFRNRREAGHLLAAHLREYADRSDVLVLALPKGGVPVAAEVASALRAPLDVLVVRKIGVPWNPELAVGAIASGGMMVLDVRVVDDLDLTHAQLDPIIQAERLELARRERVFRIGHPFPALEGQVVILVDDGLATGATMQAAVAAVKTKRPATCRCRCTGGVRACVVALESLVDRVVCLEAPEPFYGVGAWYEDFSQTTDEEVLSLLAESRENELSRRLPALDGAISADAQSLRELPTRSEDHHRADPGQIGQHVREHGPVNRTRPPGDPVVKQADRQYHSENNERRHMQQGGKDRPRDELPEAEEDGRVQHPQPRI